MVSAEFPNQTENRSGKIAGFFRNTAEYLRKNWEIASYSILTVGLGALAVFATKELSYAVIALPGGMKLLPLLLIAVPASFALISGAAALNKLANKG